MEKSLTKQELVWVITRVIGMIFVWFAAGKVGIIWTLYWISESTRTLDGSVFRPQIFLMVMYGILAFYFLTRGSWFVSLISSIGAPTPKHWNPDDPEDTNEFKEWLAQDESRKRYSLTEQLARYEEWRLDRY